MRTSKNLIVAAINLYYDGLSLRKTQKNLERLFGEKVSQVTILNWIRKYLILVKEYVKTLVPQLSGLWHEDETVIKCEGRNIWFWEMIDEDTRFLVASHLSGTRTLKDRTKPMRGLKAYESTNAILEGYTVHYNFVREHQSLLGKTPAQAARTNAPSNWKGLIDDATKYEAELFASVTDQKKRANEKEGIKVIAK